MNKKNIIYFDNSATSWPKPKEMLEVIKDFSNNIGGSPGRSGHNMSIKASRLVQETREAICKLFNYEDTSRVIFTKNITEALNICIFSFLKPGDHVITTTTEHNSVMRPLRHLEKYGLNISMLKRKKHPTQEEKKKLKQLQAKADDINSYIERGGYHSIYNPKDAEDI